MEIQPDPFVIAEDPLDFPDASLTQKPSLRHPLPGEKANEETQRLPACLTALCGSSTPDRADLCFGKPPVPILNQKGGPMPKEMLVMKN